MSQSKTKGKEKRQYTENKVVIDTGIPCPHCGHRYGHEKIRPMEGYPNGSRRRKCGGCKKNFISRTVN